MAASKVVRSVFLAADELFWVEELAVGPGPHLVDDGGLEINEDSSRNVLPCAGFAKEGVESIVSSTNSFVTWHLAIRLQK